jgi:peptidoglycan/LPS O-acetylase OafA/YrhL
MESPAPEPVTGALASWAGRLRPQSVATAFSSRANSIGFFRWLLAFSVIFSHAGPLAGFYGGHDLGTQLSSEQSLGGVAVAGFFFFSGFLITRSRARTGIIRFFWRRCLRIMPAFWLALLITAFVFGPIAWAHEQGDLSGYWRAAYDSPFTYVPQNMFLVLHQRNIAGMGSSLPFSVIGGYDWNGAAWTLQYEFKAYIMVGVLGLLGALGAVASRLATTAAALAVIALNVAVWTGHFQPFTYDGPFATVFGLPLLTDVFNPMLLAPFAFGMLFAMWGKYIPISGVLALVGLGLAFYTYDHGGWNVWGQYGLLYFLMWAAIRWTALQHWEKYGDFSYGIYIFGWPLMQLGAYFGLHERGMVVYFLVVGLAAHALAFASWHLIEKPAMSLKDWSPAAWVVARRRRSSPPAAAQEVAEEPPHEAAPTGTDHPALSGTGPASPSRQEG